MSPDDGSRTVVLKFGYWPLRVVAGALILLLVTLVLEFAFIWKIQEWRQSAQTLKEENTRLHAEVARVEELALTLKRIQGTDQKLRQMLLPDSELAPAAHANPGGIRGARAGNGEDGAPVASAVKPSSGVSARFHRFKMNSECRDKIPRALQWHRPPPVSLGIPIHNGNPAPLTNPQRTSKRTRKRILAC